MMTMGMPAILRCRISTRPPRRRAQRARVFENIMQGSQQSPTGNAQATQAAGQNISAYSQSQAQNNRDAQEQAQPGTYAPPIGHDSGSDWGRDQQEINYQPPENQQHIS